jgi:hypothetical protein
MERAIRAATPKQVRDSVARSAFFAGASCLSLFHTTRQP